MSTVFCTWIYIFWCKKIGAKAAHKTLVTFSPLVNFTNNLRLAYAPVFLRPKRSNLKRKYKKAASKTFKQKSRA